MITEGYITYRILEDGRLVGVVPLLFGRARIVITNDPSGLSHGDLW
jgi:hypothetical protein